MMITIVISSYEAYKFLPELFTSIDNQDYKDFKVLVGIDGSSNDHNWFKDNPVDAKVVYFPKNEGCYPTFNQLVSMVDTPYILFFGADDIMKPDLLSTIVPLLSQTQTVRFGFVEFGMTKSKGVLCPANGAFAIRKETFTKFKGFYNWKCAADTEFLFRTRANKITETLVCRELFSYRRHLGCLTIQPVTKMNSKLRNYYIGLININRRTNRWSPPYNNFSYTRKYITVKPEVNTETNVLKNTNLG